MTRKIFRLLILLYVALIVAGMLAAFAPQDYSQALSDAFEKEPLPAMLESPWVMIGLVIPFVLAAAAGLYGLYRFRRWGRALSLYSTATGLVLFPFFGPALYSGLESALLEATTLLWGGILTLSYYSPLSRCFEPASPAAE